MRPRAIGPGPRPGGCPNRSFPPGTHAARGSGEHEGRRAPQSPAETGVIDIAGFLQALQSIGYNGPVTPEPFKNELKDLPDDAARLKTVGAGMDKIFQQAGLR